MNIIASIIAGALLLAGCGSAPVADPIPLVTPSASVAQANQRVADVAAEQQRVESRYLDQEQVCYQRFFVTNCLDKAKEERRLALIVTSARDNEAQRYLRQAALNERDAAIAKADADYRAAEAKAAETPPREPHALTQAPPPKPRSVPQRQARHATRQRAVAARDQAEAPQRAANVAALEKRKAESAQRQKDVAARKAEHK